jgi:hypothetical protein
MHGWRTRVIGGRFVVLALLVYVLLRPLFALGHQLGVWLVATCLHSFVATNIWQPVIGLLGLDPVYTGAFFQAAGGVQIAGIAIAGPIGAALHSLAGGAFLDPARVAHGAGVSLVALPGAPVLGRDLARLGGDIIWLGIGVVLTRRGTSGAVVLLGWLIQGQIVVNHLLDGHVGVANLEASGLPFAVAMLMPGNAGWFTRTLEQMPDLLRSTLVGACIVLAAYACALLALFVISRFARRTPTLRPRTGPRMTLVAASIAVATAASPIGALAFGTANWDVNLPRQLAAARVDRLDAANGASSLLGPSVVQIQSNQDGSFEYLVNGQPEVIRGVGYNPQYAGLSDDQRAQLYERDFSAMRARGINTIEGWFEPQFDDVTLDYAARNGIGVLMPFELNQDWPYDNPNVQQSILDHVSAYVERYKDSPAVRMWAPGNEDLHRILYPHLKSGQDDPAVRTQADAFAAFLPRLVDRIHELDPNHPVIYRDAEDLYLPRLKAAFAATGVDRPWLVYGANVYTEPRLQQIINAWPAQFTGPLVISEYAPGGQGPTDRPLGYQEDWAIIRARPGIVLGGLAYTWATNGPEQLDRVFGLVDAQGIPTDGALAALSASYLNDLRASSGQSL